MRCQFLQRTFLASVTLACLALIGSSACGQGVNNQGGPAFGQAAPQPGLAPGASVGTPAGVIAGSELRIQDIKPAGPNEHPLTPIIAIAKAGLSRIENGVRDYECMMYKRERINGKLGDYEAMQVKIRQKPFSVYMKFVYPAPKANQEVIFVTGKNDGKMIAHAGSGLQARFGAVPLLPTSFLAMRDNRYPITEVGIGNLTKRLIEVGEQDMKFGECTVRYDNMELNLQNEKRKVTRILVEHPVPRRNFLFYQAMIYVDHELQLPIRYEAYDWPAQAGQPGQLVEEYTYGNIRVNQNLTDADFETTNKNYRFVSH